MNQLFETHIRLPVPDAEIRLWHTLEWRPDPDECLRRLLAEIPWRQDDVRVYGKTHPQPRLHAWYGDAGTRYSYSGLSLEPLPWTPLLASLKQQVEAVTGAGFNSVLLNYYRDHRDSMGMHADDEPELGPDPVIASISFGEERLLRFRHRRDGSIKPVNISCPHGSLLVMSGATQSNWHHGINKLTRPCGPRVNLTFRRIVNLR